MTSGNREIPKLMKAVGYSESLPIADEASLVDLELSTPEVSGRDVLVKVEAIAVNPVDYKIRQRFTPEKGDYRVLGWDAVGEVVAIGEAVTRFQPGDKVYYAGDLNRQGSNAEYQLVDERLAGHKPGTLSAAEAAALPLTTITAWELLFEHLTLARVDPKPSSELERALKEPVSHNEVLLITGAAGGVGSILIQLVKRLTGAMVIATASRPSSKQWVRDLGADHVIDHSQPLLPQIQALGVTVTHVASLTHTDSYFDQYIELLAPFGKIAFIDDPATLDVMKLKPKSLSLHIEFMFARSMFNAVDMDQQGELLNQVATMVDEGRLVTTLGQNLGVIHAKNLRQAHEELESGQSIGKIVLEGF